MVVNTEIDALKQMLTDESRVGFWQRRQAAQRLARLATGDSHAASLSPAEGRSVVEGLAAGLESVHWGPHLICRRALEHLTSLPLIEVLCDLLLEQDLPRLRTLAVHRSYAPQDPIRRAAYLFVLGRLQFYEAHDPDGTLMEQFYLGASRILRERLLGLARSRGDQHWTHWLTSLGSYQGWEALGEAELDAVIEMFRQEQRWEALWSLVLTGKVLWSWRGAQALSAAGWQPLDRRVATCWEELIAAGRMIDTPPAVGELVGRQRSVLCGHQGYVSALAMSPNGRLLASGGEDRTVRLWALPGGQEEIVLRGHQDVVSALAMSPDGKLLASSSHDRTIRLWELPKGQAQAVLRGHQGWVSALAMSPDGKLLASSSHDGTIRLWELPSGQARAVLHEHWRVSVLAVSPDGQLLASGNNDGTIRLLGLPEGQEHAVLRRHLWWVQALAMSPDGKLLASSSRDGAIHLWELPQGRRQAVLRGHQGWVSALVMSPDGQFLVSGNNDGIIRLLGLPTGQVHVVLRGHQSGVSTLEMSSDGQLLASGSHDGTIRLWDLWDLHQIVRVPLGRMGQQDFEYAQRFEAETSLSPAQRAVARYVAAVLCYRLKKKK